MWDVYADDSVQYFTTLMRDDARVALGASRLAMSTVVLGCTSVILAIMARTPPLSLYSSSMYTWENQYVVQEVI